LPVTAQDAHFLVVDDNSPDGTGMLADGIAEQNPRVHVLHRPGKQGLGTALCRRVSLGLGQGYDAFVEMDADFSHNPKYLPEMLRLLVENDVVIGSRYVDGGGTVNWGLGRRLLSLGGSMYSADDSLAPRFVILRAASNGMAGRPMCLMRSISGLCGSDGYFLSKLSSNIGRFEAFLSSGSSD